MHKRRFMRGELRVTSQRTPAAVVTALGRGRTPLPPCGTPRIVIVGGGVAGLLLATRSENVSPACEAGSHWSTAAGPM